MVCDRFTSRRARKAFNVRVKVLTAELLGVTDVATLTMMVTSTKKSRQPHTLRSMAFGEKMSPSAITRMTASRKKIVPSEASVRLNQVNRM